jgi:hypothetical protein
VVSVWTPEFGVVVLKEFRSSSGRVYLRGWDNAGRVHIQTVDIPPSPFNAADWMGEVRWKES